MEKTKEEKLERRAVLEKLGIRLAEFTLKYDEDGLLPRIKEDGIEKMGAVCSILVLTSSTLAINYLLATSHVIEDDDRYTDEDILALSELVLDIQSFKASEKEYVE